MHASHAEAELNAVWFDQVPAAHGVHATLLIW
jgi:hypothetical protein